MATPSTMPRIWERRAVPTADGSLEVPLRFRAIPGTWPNIELAAADGTRADVSAPAHEVNIRFDPGERGTLLVEIGGFRIAFDGRTTTTAEETFSVPGSAPIEVVLYLRGDTATLVVDDAAPRLLSIRTVEAVGDAAPITANIAGFRLSARPSSVGRIRPHGGTEIIDARIFGLRDVESLLHRRTAAATGGSGRTFYEAPSFVVADGSVTESGDTVSAALVPDRHTIVSPIRIVEEFVWRDNSWGDMNRVADRSEMWRSSVEPGRFPQLTTHFRSVDAAFGLALETFQRNASGEFSLPGESGLWSAGYFQGSGLGFGSWKRDTSHIALRSGNLIDPDVARASLAYIASSGFDNGSDGDSLPAVAIWDYLLATGDESLISETWPSLASTVATLDARFDEHRDLVRAPQSTSNDLFEEPESGGFALSTEVYSMQTYEALSKMGSLRGIEDARAGMWAARAAAMRRAITSQYWNPEYGYFTSGPVGTESYDRGLWETSGIEASLWGFLGDQSEAMTASVLSAMRSVAMSEYGVVLFPHRDADDHFAHSVWYCWQAGIARAAARVGDAGLVHQLIGQQVRTVVRNKTFYEVTDSRNGDSWRWPGQLWHAAGFVSLVLFGVLGVRYGVDGLTFNPTVVPEFDGARLTGLRYRAAVLDIEIRGHGSRSELTLDGRIVDKIDPNVVGRHAVTLTMTT
jgi:hypothetical protein